MEDVLEYIKDLIPETKLIILSYLPYDLLLKIGTDQYNSDILFGLLFSKYHLELKNIIKLNKSLGFRKYNSNSSYLWDILLEDELYYNIYSYESGKRLNYLPWDRYFEHMNIISINFKILVKLNQMMPKYYKYVESMIKD